MPAVLLLAAAVYVYALYVPHLPWKQANFDQAAYRYVAEHFWGVGHDRSTYERGFLRLWGALLTQMPFRDIGVGTVYIVVKAVVGGGAKTIGSAFAAVMIAFWCVSFAVFYRVVQLRYGTTRAIIALGFLILPLESWQMTGRLMSESSLRALFVLGLAALIPLRSDGKNLMRCALLFYLAALFMVHVKMQWIMYPALMTPFFLWLAVRKREWKEFLGIAAAALVIPLSLVFVHQVGWGTSALTEGAGLHAMKWTDGRIFDYTCDRLAEQSHLPNFCVNQHHTYFYQFLGSQNPSMNMANLVRALDANVIPYTLESPSRMGERAMEGLLAASDFPFWKDQSLFFHTVELFFVLYVLLVALRDRHTTVLSAAALGLWVVPAVSNIVALYDPRYHQPMAALPLIVAMLVGGRTFEALKEAVPIPLPQPQEA